MACQTTRWVNDNPSKICVLSFNPFFMFSDCHQLDLRNNMCCINKSTMDILIFGYGYRKYMWC